MMTPRFYGNPPNQHGNRIIVSEGELVLVVPQNDLRHPAESVVGVEIHRIWPLGTLSESFIVQLNPKLN